MSQFEQENDLGRGGGEVDDETMERAWSTRDELVHARERPEPENDDAPGPEQAAARGLTALNGAGRSRSGRSVSIMFERSRVGPRGRAAAA